MIIIHDKLDNPALDAIAYDLGNRDLTFLGYRCGNAHHFFLTMDKSNALNRFIQAEFSNTPMRDRYGVPRGRDQGKKVNNRGQTPSFDRLADGGGAADDEEARDFDRITRFENRIRPRWRDP